MDNTRKLTGTDVPEQAINSIKSMIEDLADALVKDYNDGLKRNNQVINVADLNTILDNKKSEMSIQISLIEKIESQINKLKNRLAYEQSAQSELEDIILIASDDVAELVDPDITGYQKNGGTKNDNKIL